MSRIRRRFLIDPADVGVYHCINRCIRRSFLCGTDQASGKSYDHRKQWIQNEPGVSDVVNLRGKN